MKLEDLKAGGLYRITQATPNPNRDRRVNSEWTRMDLPEGGELLCVIHAQRDRDPDVKASTIEVRAYAGLAGVGRYASTALLGWRFDDGRTKQRVQSRADEDDTYAAFVATLLGVIEPFEPRDVDDALAVFNATGRPEISYEEIALTLLDESKDSTAAILERTRARLAQFDAETGTDDYHEYDRRLREFNAKAYKPAGDSAGDPEPEHTILKGGAIECHGCGVKFTAAFAPGPAGFTGLPVTELRPAVAFFLKHLPCKGKR